MTNLVRNNPPTDATVLCSIDAKCGRVTACGTCPSSTRSYWARVFSESTRALLTGIGHVDVHNTSPRSTATVLGHTRRRIKRYSAKQSTHIPLNFISYSFQLLRRRTARSTAVGDNPSRKCRRVIAKQRLLGLSSKQAENHRKDKFHPAVRIRRRELMVSAGGMQRYR